MIKMKYEQLTTVEALKAYCDWILEQQTEGPFFRCYELGKPLYEWYMVFYPVRALLLAGKVLKEQKYITAAIPYVDLYLTEQLPNGAFTSNYRKTPAEKLTKEAYHDILRNGKVNLADNGSNITAIIQAAGFVDAYKKEKYVQAVRRWFDQWVPIWALPNGGYGNGIWEGHKLNAPYTCAMANVTTALSAFGRLTGEYEYIENAERCMAFQCSKWMPDEDGRPINLDCYPIPKETVLSDLGHSFYLLEGMCWLHSVSKDSELKKLLESKLSMWIFGNRGLLSQWGDSWFNYMVKSFNPQDPIPGSRGQGVRLGWEMAKSNGIIHAFIYYLNHISESKQLREKVELGLKYLTHPLKARMSGVASDPDESYGAFAVQSTGFACLSILEALQSDSAFGIE